MNQKFFWLFPLLIMHGAAALAQIPMSKSSAEQYHSCTQLVSSDPKAALTMAQIWGNEAGAPAAIHCKALALFALKQFAPAAETLEQLTAAVGDASVELWVSIMQQSATAWDMAGDSAKAMASLDKAVMRAEDAAQMVLASRILLDKAEKYEQKGENYQAIQELDHAIEIAPDNAVALLRRATLLHAMKEDDLAKQDVAALLKLNPKHAEALALKKQLQPKKK